MSVKRFDGSNQIDISNNKRFDGSNWIDVSSQKRYDGSNWIETLATPLIFTYNASWSSNVSKLTIGKQSDTAVNLSITVTTSSSYAYVYLTTNDYSLVKDEVVTISSKGSTSKGVTVYLQATNNDGSRAEVKSLTSYSETSFTPASTGSTLCFKIRRDPTVATLNPVSATIDVKYIKINGKVYKPVFV